jgi:hypothetical protein
VCKACFPKCFRAPNNVIKYDHKTNLNIWLEDYHLLCKADRVDDDLFVIQFLPIYLADTTKDWLDHLPRNSINCWEDPKEIFSRNFHGTYVRPGIPEDLKGCRRKQDESLQDDFEKLLKVTYSNHV